MSECFNGTGGRCFCWNKVNWPGFEFFGHLYERFKDCLKYYSQGLQHDHFGNINVSQREISLEGFESLCCGCNAEAVQVLGKGIASN